MKKTITYECECSPCNGTGLYVGMAENDRSAIVCQRCKGAGKNDVKITYKTFTGKKNRKDIKRVFQCNPGIGIGKEEGKFELSDFGGMPYKDWKKGKEFTVGTEMRKYVCPVWWYQTADCKKNPNPKWKECTFGSFSSCSSFETKAKCWQRWDIENGNYNISDLMKSNNIDPVLIQRKIKNEKKNNT